MSLWTVVNILLLLSAVIAIAMYWNKLISFFLRHPLLFSVSKPEVRVISEYKALLLFCKKHLPESYWPIVYFSGICDTPYSYIRTFLYVFIGNLVVLLYFMQSILTLLAALLVSIIIILVKVFQTSYENKTIFDNELPIVIKLIKDAIASGLSLQQALDVVVQDIEGPAKKIFSTITHKKKLGMSYEKILAFEKENIQNQEFVLFCSAININEDAGGQLDKVLERLEYILSSRKKLGQTISISIASSKSSGYMVMGIQVSLIAYLAYVQGDKFINFFLYDKSGQTMSTIIAALFCFNLLLINGVVMYIRKLR